MPLLKYLARCHLARGEPADGLAAALCTLSVLRTRFPVRSSERAAATAEAAAAMEAVRAAAGPDPTSLVAGGHPYLQASDVTPEAAAGLVRELGTPCCLPDLMAELAVWFGRGGALALHDHIHALLGLPPLVPPPPCPRPLCIE